MNKTMMTGVVVVLAVVGMAQSDCGGATSDSTQRGQQEKLLAEGTAQAGMPAITNFRERKLLKDILEMRDQDGLSTHTYLFAELTGKLTKVCDSIGYGLPYATQYTNPEKPLFENRGDVPVIAQADPNGLFSPASAEGTWVLCNDGSKGVRPVYLEPRIVVSPFPLN